VQLQILIFLFGQDGYAFALQFHVELLKVGVASLI